MRGRIFCWVLLVAVWACGVGREELARVEVEALEVLQHLVQEGDEVLAVRAVDALGAFGPGAVDALIEALAHSDETVVFKAVRALSDIGAPRAVDPLEAVWKADRGSFVQVQTAVALVRLGRPEKRAWLVEALQTGALSITRANAAAALGRLGDEAPVLREAFRTDADPAVRSSAALAMARLDDREMLPAIGDTLVQSGSVVVSMALVEALETFDDPAVVPYLEAAVVEQKVPYYVRQRSLEVMGKLGRRDVGPYLQGLLSGSDNAAHRYLAAEGLGVIRDTSAVSLLIDTFEKDPVIPVRLGAAEALARLGAGLEISSKLAHYLMNENDSFRVRTLEAMALIGDAQQAPLLKEAMFLLPSIEVHRGIVAALATIDDDVAVEVLKQGYNGLQEPEVREAIVEALADVDRAPAQKVLLRILKGAEIPGVRTAALHGLARWGDLDQVAVLRPYLKNIDPEVRFQAASGILQLSTGAKEN